MKKHASSRSDISVEVEAVRLQICRQMPAWRKVERVDDAIRTGRQLALIGLRKRHPDDSPARLRRRLLGLILGEETAATIDGPPGTEPVLGCVFVRGT